MDPSAQLLARIQGANPIPRNFPVPELPMGPPPVFAEIAAAPILARAAELADPLAAQIVETIRGAIAGVPEALRMIGQNLPPPSAVFSGASLGFGVASLAVGLTGQAAALLAAPAGAVPYLGPALAGYGAASPAIAAALGAAGGGFGALGQAVQGGPAVDFSALTKQWGQFLPGNPTAAAIPPPPVMA